VLLDFQESKDLYSLKWKLLAKGKNLDTINKILGERWREEYDRRQKQKSLGELLEG
jgi:hypothetical protein